MIHHIRATTKESMVDDEKCGQQLFLGNALCQNSVKMYCVLYTDYLYSMWRLKSKNDSAEVINDGPLSITFLARLRNWKITSPHILQNV